MYKKKWIVISTLIVGFLISAGVFISEKYSKSDPRILYRNDYGQGESKVTLRAEYLDNYKDMTIVVAEREYADEELDDKVSKLKGELLLTLLSDNSDLSNIESDIYLPSDVDGYPFYLRWDISDTDVINSGGHIICEPDCRNNHEVIVNAYVSYKEYRNNIEYRLIVKHPTKDELTMAEYYIQKNIESVNESDKYERYIILPDLVKGIRISWSKPVSRNSLYIFIASIVIAILLGWAYEQDEKKKEARIRQDLEDIYPLFVDKLRMYLLSGLNTKSSIINIYKNISQHREDKYKYLIKILRKLNNYYKNGVAEEKIYEELGRMCGGSYKKLCFLLSVNLKKGNDKLLTMMSLESDKALAYRKNMAMKKCDEAGVKMLFPMILMLIVVMLMIIIPAYLGIV